MDFKVLGKNIRKYRRLAEITQEQLAEFCDCSHSHLGAIEQGKVNVSVELLVKIANVLRVTADQLLTTNYVAPELSLLKEIEERYNIKLRKTKPKNITLIIPTITLKTVFIYYPLIYIN